MAHGKLSRRHTQIDDLPSCLIIDILSRVPIETLVISRFVCRSWFLLFSDPEFVRLHRARSRTRLLSRRSGLKRNLKCYKSVGKMVGKDSELDFKVGRLYSTDMVTCVNSCHGLLCLRKPKCDEIYVCNPILGEYITIPIVKTKSELFLFTKYVLGFSSRSNQFKVIRLHHYNKVHVRAEIYTIGNGTLQWKSIGIPPRCTLDFPDDSVNSFLNGSIHWADAQSQHIVYFDFESEQFGSLPAPPAWRDGRWSSLPGPPNSQVRVGVSDGCLCILGFSRLNGEQAQLMESWMMKEYGVEESWTDIFSTHKNKFQIELFYSWDPTSCCVYGLQSAYCPSFISLQDVAKSEHLTLLSKTRTKDQGAREVISDIIFQLQE